MKPISTKLGLMVIIIVIIITSITAIYLKETYYFYPLNNTENIVVIKPIFTSSAYQEKGFYDYYKHYCGLQCLTVKITDTKSFETSKNAIAIFEWNKIKIITDIDVHNNPKILSQYKTVIILHNEYVSQKEFDSIMSHTNIIYLYPNALYGKIKYSEDNKTITLERGHNYPELAIKNGFNWKNDNSEMEYDTDCKTWEYYKVENGYMLNCYPEHVIKTNIDILEKLDKLVE